jgi:hypothetical protein
MYQRKTVSSGSEIKKQQKKYEHVSTLGSADPAEHSKALSRFLVKQT